MIDVIKILNDVFLGTAPQKPIQPVKLPADELEHSCAVEWWYFVGHVREQGGSDRFAFEMTAARLRAAAAPPFDTCYLSVIDLQKKDYVSADRQSPYAYDENAGHLRLAYEPPLGQPGTWTIEGWDAPPAAVRYRLEAAFQAKGKQRGISLSLVDKAAKPVLLHGKNGVLDLYGLDLGYYSRTRLAISGGLKIDGRSLLVAGDGWMDHEYGAADLPGSLWTFVAIQLDSGEELCVYQVGQKNPNQPGAPCGYLVTSGKSVVVGAATLTPYGNPWGPWGYPLHQRVQLALTATGQFFDLLIEPEIEDQRRVPTGKAALPFVTFWEGAARVLDAKTKLPAGRAFLELAGYE